ncbi:MAG: UDP-glucose/GDP-mannose dehydrogenase family protein [Deltaproteobacteria bacterium]|nr:MAG: UDP-glucose/GDP-mannose dehydrogenase family protein [Deltaproteobacteria bacterium]
MKLAVLGAGYVGLVAGTCFSDTGNHVTVVDTNPERVASLNRGEVPIYEPGLAEIIKRNTERGRLRFTTSVSEAVPGAQVVILAVGTPSAPDGTVNLDYILQAARDVAGAMTGYTVLVTKSTVPVGFHKQLAELVSAHTEHPFAVVSNPEFLKEGTAVSDFMGPDRVILGATDERAIETMRHLYSAFMRRSDRLIVMDPTSAELTKYACNAMLAARVSFMNEMSQLCDHYGADVTQVRVGMGTDPRIGPHFLYASLGYGGSCFPKDVSALVSMGRAANIPMRMVEATEMANAGQRERFFERVRHHFDGKLADKRIAVWGLAFKARTDDIRESAAITLVERLAGAGAHVVAHDPKAMDNARKRLGERTLTLVDDEYAALDEADALVICTEWQAYRTPDFAQIKERMKGDIIFDGRNLYDLEWMAETELTYVSIGRPSVP